MKKDLPPIIALIPIAFLIFMLYITISSFGTDALAGGSQISLLATSAVCAVIGIGFFGRKWKDFEKAISHNLGSTSIAIIILLIIGALSGTWMISGVVPTLIYYGVKIIHPDFFLTTTCIICALVSVMTGSSWTTIATIGIALMGIGQAQGFHEGWIAGAIISGAYFGDKMSPLSDTTVLTASTTGTSLFRHIKYMFITTIPTIVITLIIFTIMGLSHNSANTEHIVDMTQALDSRFNISPWLFLVPIITAVMIAFKVPSLVTLFASTLVGALFAILFQPDILMEISEGDGLFKGSMISIYGSTSIHTDNAMLSELISTRGMSGMLNTVWLIICAMCFGASMQASGVIESITNVFIRFMKKRLSVVSSTVASGLFLNITTADQYLSIILTGSMFKKIYEDKGYESCLLSRTCEDAVTVTSPLIPWNTCGMTQATILNVSTITYLPYCFFNLISPIMSIIIASIGYKIKRITK